MTDDTQAHRVVAEALCAAGCDHYRGWDHDMAAAVMDPGHDEVAAAMLTHEPLRAALLRGLAGSVERVEADRWRGWVRDLVDGGPWAEDLTCIGCGKRQSRIEHGGGHTGSCAYINAKAALNIPAPAPAASVLRELSHTRADGTCAGCGERADRATGDCACTTPCDFYPAHESFSCRVHLGVRIALDLAVCNRAPAASVSVSALVEALSRYTMLTISPPHQANEDGEYTDWAVWTDETAASGETLMDALAALDAPPAPTEAVEP